MLATETENYKVHYGLVSRSETLYLKQRVYFEKGEYRQALQICDELIESQQQATDHEAAQRTDFCDLGYYMYLKGQVLERLGAEKEEIVEVVEIAIAMLESQGPPFEDNLAQLYKTKGGMLEQLLRHEEAIRFFQKAVDLYNELGNF